MLKSLELKFKDSKSRILIDRGLFREAGKHVKSIARSKKVVVLSCESVFKLYGQELLKNLTRNGFQIFPIVIPDGESQKNEKRLFGILKSFAEFGLQKDGTLVSLGGGVVGDLGGLAASVYMRGIHYIQIPTTLLSQVDASIGGKTGIDFEGIKNLIGTFYQPQMVLIDPMLLKTLDVRQMKTGMAEVIKSGVIQDEKLFASIEAQKVPITNYSAEFLNKIISTSCAIKVKIVSLDEKEKGIRAWLNYGHTLGHALESYFNYNVLTHGEAIAYGMWFAALLSFKMGICPKVVLTRQFELLKKVELFRKMPLFPPRKIYQKMFLDKKARNGQIQFILTRKIGLVTIQKNISKSLILSTLNQIQTEAKEL